MAIGTTGTLREMHNAAVPGLNGPMAPVLERVPSGNNSNGTPSVSS